MNKNDNLSTNFENNINIKEKENEKKVRFVDDNNSEGGSDIGFDIDEFQNIMMDNDNDN